MIIADIILIAIVAYIAAILTHQQDRVIISLAKIRNELASLRYLTKNRKFIIASHPDENKPLMPLAMSGFLQPLPKNGEADIPNQEKLETILERMNNEY